MGVAAARSWYGIRQFHKGFLDGYDKDSLDRILKRGKYKPSDITPEEEEFIKEITQLKYLESSEATKRLQKLESQAPHFKRLKNKINPQQLLGLPQSITQQLPFYESKFTKIKKGLKYISEKFKKK